MSGQAMPDPEVWPVCPEHHRPYVLRRCYSLTGPSLWLWQSDCPKSCKATPAIHNAAGVVEVTP
jgi:hypothetical protein